MKDRTMKFARDFQISLHFAWQIVRPGQGEQRHKSLRHRDAQTVLLVCAGLKISACDFTVLLWESKNFWRDLCMLLVLQRCSYSLVCPDDALENGWTEGFPTNPVSLSPFIWYLQLCCSMPSTPCETEHHLSSAQGYNKMLGCSFSLN